jgi:type II secretory ATPase GspE/PulE/Tfp pilus assembly ATPase PilB-like protein
MLGWVIIIRDTRLINTYMIGEILLKNKLIKKYDIQKALAIQKEEENARRLGQILIDLGILKDENVFLPLLAEQVGLEFVSLKEQTIPWEVIERISAKYATFYKVLPIKFQDNILTIATAYPVDITLLDQISLVVSDQITFVIASQKDIVEGIRFYYGVGAETVDRIMDNVSTEQAQQETEEIDELDSEASISKLLTQILHEAFQERATDIHIEPAEDELKLRYRIDGVLHDAKAPRNMKFFQESIIARIKILSNLNIAEKRMPQDGRFKLRSKGVELDLRVSFLPTPTGESVVIRLLNATRLYRFQELGLDKQERMWLEDLIKKPHGIIFLTGPTGSGKTTTLYSCLSKINTDQNKIITIEDPVEYQIKGVTHIQVNPEIGLTFAHGLRSMLRHDPDIMMIGEVRDRETAEIAIQIALTGHLVFSTLHTNDAASGVVRLLDMNIDPFLITSTVECFIAQRLVRVLCQNCKEKVTDLDSVRSRFQAFIKPRDRMSVFAPKGCEKCQQTGFIGRQAIVEFLMMDEGLRNLIMQQSTSDVIKEYAVNHGMKTLLQSGWEKIKKGITSVDEVLRVVEK